MRIKTHNLNQTSGKDLTAIFLLALLSIIVFFESYRLLVFNTTPHDSYNLIVEFWLGNVDLENMQSPTFYRFLYTFLASLIVEYGPSPIVFSNSVELITPGAAKIWMSLALVSAIFYFLFLISVYFNLSRDSFTFANVMTTIFIISLCLNFIAFFGVDPITLCWIFWILTAKNKHLLYAVLCFFSIVVNDKVPLLIFIYNVAEYLFTTNKSKYRLFVSIIACFLYYLMVKLIPLKGYEAQWAMGTYISGFIYGIPHLFTIKGLYVNFLPTIIILFFVLQSKLSNLGKIDFPTLAVFLFTFYLGLTYSGIQSLDGEYVIGRYVMHGIPFIVGNISKYVSIFDA